MFHKCCQAELVEAGLLKMELALTEARLRQAQADIEIV